MKNRVTGDAAALTATPLSPTLAELRAQLTSLTFGNILLSEAEQLQANHRIFECEDIGQLIKWLINVPIELARRTARAEACCTEQTVCDEIPASPCYATTTQKETIKSLLQRPGFSRAVKTRIFLALNCLTIPDARRLLRQLWAHVPFDIRATLPDLRVAARFAIGQPLPNEAMSLL